MPIDLPVKEVYSQNIGINVLLVKLILLTTIHPKASTLNANLFTSL